MKMIIVTIATLVTALTLSSCGSAPSDETSSLNALQPNLRFVGATVQVLTVPGTPVLAQGGTVIVPCNTNGMRIKYRYGNGGAAFAGAHRNSGQAAGSPAYSFAMGALGSGMAREALISIGAIVNPNVATPIAIRLDHTNLVAETNEGDNLFKAFAFRKCP